MSNEIFYIYIITNKINKKQYIGLTTRTIEQRWKDHCRAVKYHSKTYLHKAIKKYNSINFEIQILDTCSDFDLLNKKEQFYIEKYNTIAPFGYNLTTGGEQYRFTDEHKKRLSILRKNTQNGRKNNFYGKHHTSDSKKKMSNTRKKLIKEGVITFNNRKCSQEQREHLSQKAIERYIKKMNITMDEYEKTKKIIMNPVEVGIFLSKIISGSKNPFAKRFILITPDKKIIKIHGNLYHTLKINGLKYYHMYKVLTKKISDHKGWILKYDN